MVKYDVMSGIFEVISKADMFASACLFFIVGYIFKKISKLESIITNKKLSIDFPKSELSQQKSNYIQNILLASLSGILFFSCGYLLTTVSNQLILNNIAEFSGYLSMVCMLFFFMFSLYEVKFKNAALTATSVLLIIIMFYVFNFLKLENSYPAISQIGWNISVTLMTVVLLVNSIG